MDEEISNMEVEVRGGGGGIEAGADGAVLARVRENNFESMWKRTVRDIGTVLGEAAEKEAGKAAAKTAAGEKPPGGGSGWDFRKLHRATSGRCSANFFLAEVAVSYGGDAAAGLLNPAKGHILEIKQELPARGGEVRAREATMMVAGGWADREELERVRSGRREVSDGEREELSQRLGWAVQRVTEGMCGELFRVQTEMNKAGKVAGPDFDWTKYGCDKQKVGVYSMELVVATFEYQRKGGWELAYPLSEEKEGGEGKEEGGEREEGRLLRNLFVKWIQKHEKSKRAGKKRNNK